MNVFDSENVQQSTYFSDDVNSLLIAVIAESLQDPNFPFVLLIFFHYQAILYIQTCRCLVSLSVSHSDSVTRPLSQYGPRF